MSNMTDVGNVYTRKLEDEYLSVPIKKPERAHFSRIHWKAETPLGTSIRLQIRAAQSSEGAERSNLDWIIGCVVFYSLR